MRNESTYKLIIGLLSASLVCVVCVSVTLLLTLNNNARNSQENQPQEQSTIIDEDESDETNLTENETEEANEKDYRPRVYKVYFHYPQDAFSLDTVKAVERETERLDVLTYLTEQIILGPTDEERIQGLVGYSENPFFVSGSNCGGKDFKISIDGEITTLQFCREIIGTGDGPEAGFLNSVKQTYKQFDNVVHVSVLNSNNDCLFDESGLNLCFKNKLKLFLPSINTTEPVEIPHSTNEEMLAIYALERLLEVELDINWNKNFENRLYNFSDKGYYGDRPFFANDSSCNGRAFQVTESNKIAELRLCRSINFPQNSIEVRSLINTIEKNLLQFEEIDSLKIFKKDGSCIYSSTSDQRCDLS